MIESALQDAGAGQKISFMYMIDAILRNKSAPESVTAHYVEEFAARISAIAAEASKCIPEHRVCESLKVDPSTNDVLINTRVRYTGKRTQVVGHLEG